MDSNSSDSCTPGVKEVGVPRNESPVCRTCYNYILYGCKGTVKTAEDCKAHWTDAQAEQEAQDLEARLEEHAKNVGVPQ